MTQSRRAPPANRHPKHPSPSLYFPLRFFLLHSPILWRIGMKLCPSGVREYSTLGGTSLYTSRWTMLSSSNSLNCLVNIPFEIFGSSRWSSLNLLVCVLRFHKMMIFHFPAMMSCVCVTGQTVSSICSSARSPNRLLAMINASLSQWSCFCY